MLGGLEINPPAYFTVFGRPVYFYGVLIGIGFLLGILLCAKRAKRFGLTEDNVYDAVLWVIPCSILGARLYYVAFRLDYYLDHLDEFFAVWNGGLAIYGGVIAGILAVALVCRRKKIPFFAMLDDLTYGLLVGQIIGRWGNFMNREAFGAETDIFCRMGLTAPDGTTVYVHPTFLYESLWNVGVLAFLLWFEKKGKLRFDGQCLTLYFLLYGIGRFWIEGLRTDSLYIGSTGIRVSQALSLVLVIFAAAILLWKRKQGYREEDLYVNRVNAPAVILPPEEKEEQEPPQSGQGPDSSPGEGANKEGDYDG
ncbi:MAG: prolipoprotein diacylglyceryl transferase [Oscillospiraceae bacterium]|nr:prolipoprotein diacylglyceryl transferase [Oscillospiraceae bacterium]